MLGGHKYQELWFLRDPAFSHMWKPVVLQFLCPSILSSTFFENTFRKSIEKFQIESLLQNVNNKKSKEKEQSTGEHRMC